MKKQRLLFIFFSVALLLCWSVILSLPKDSHAAVINLPATGQTKCYNSSGAEIACAGTGQDGDKRMGVAWPNPRFTVNGDCITDNLTGQIWPQNANIANGTKTWQGALDFVKSLNAGGGLCGKTDWRLPSILELESLANEGYNEGRTSRAPAAPLPQLPFTGLTTKNSVAWSATSSAGSAVLTFDFNGNSTGDDQFIGVNIDLPVHDVPCEYNLTYNLDSILFGANGGTGVINVITSEAYCPWRVIEWPLWIVILSGSHGTGSGLISFTALANLDTSSPTRKGTISIRGNIESVGEVILTQFSTDYSSR